MDNPPNWATMDGIAVATTVPSIEAKNKLSKIPAVIILMRFCDKV